MSQLGLGPQRWFMVMLLATGVARREGELARMSFRLLYRLWSELSPYRV
jgi:hypothetical protein